MKPQPEQNSGGGKLVWFSDESPAVICGTFCFAPPTAPASCCTCIGSGATRPPPLWSPAAAASCWPGTGCGSTWPPPTGSLASTAEAASASDSISSSWAPTSWCSCSRLASASSSNSGSSSARSSNSGSSPRDQLGLVRAWELLTVEFNGSVSLGLCCVPKHEASPAGVSVSQWHL